jgi:hypothetical protein
LTTAGAARATESAKLCMTTGTAGTVGPADAADKAGEVFGAAGAVGEAVTAVACVRAVCAPNNVGFHQTTRNATARPTTTALTKKLTRTRVFFN